MLLTPEYSRQLGIIVTIVVFDNETEEQSEEKDEDEEKDEEKDDEKDEHERY